MTVNNVCNFYNVPVEIRNSILEYACLSEGNHIQRNVVVVCQLWKSFFENFEVSLLVQMKIRLVDIPKAKTEKAMKEYLDLHATSLTQLDISKCRVPINGVVNSITHLKTLIMSSVFRLDENIISQFSNLTHLDISKNFIFSSGVLANVAKLTHLNRLNLDLITSDAEEISEIATLTNLSHLSLECSNLSDSIFAKLSSLNHLAYLNLEECRKVVELPGLEFFTNLTHLNLRTCSGINDKALLYLSNAKKLTFLDLLKCEKISDRGLSEVFRFTHLASLDLYDVRIKYQTFCDVTKLSNLTHLSLGTSSSSSEDCIPQSFLFEVVKLKQLVSLKFSSSLAQDQDFHGITKLTSLTKLYMGMNNYITDRCLVDLAALTNLTYLSIGLCKNITASGLNSLIPKHVNIVR